MAIVKESAFVKFPINILSNAQMIKLINKYHSDGFMVYWLLLAYLQGTDNAEFNRQDLPELSMAILRLDFDKTSAIIDYCLDIGLLETIDVNDTIIISPMLMEQREKMERIRAERSRAGKASVEKKAAEKREAEKNGFSVFEFPLKDGTFYKLPATLLAEWETQYKNVTGILNYIQDYFKEPKNRLTKTAIQKKLLEWIKSNQK